MRAAGHDVICGRLILGGKVVATPEDKYDYGFVRLDGGGAIDSSFAGGKTLDLAYLAPIAQLNDLARDGDGRLLYVGDSSATAAVIGRRRADGVADPGFNGNGYRFLGAGYFVDAGTFLSLQRIVALPDGKILAVGYAAGPSVRACAAAVRLHSDGSIDTGFGPGGSGRICIAETLQATLGTVAYDVAVLPDGRYLLAGAALHPGGSSADMSVARLLPDGSLDASFGPSGNGWAYAAFDSGGELYEEALAVAFDASGRVVLAGRVSTQAGEDIGVARLTPAGDADTSFGFGGRVQIAFDLGGWNDERAHSLQILGDGRLLLGCWTQVNTTVGIAAMLKPDGSLDRRFGEQGRFVQSDPNGPRSSIVPSERQYLDGDHLYMIGSSYDDAGQNLDLAATRCVIPLFADDFEAVP